eukprot:m.25094 g.25094  ORF g.25094 m.25094 type:complete len:360 (+) comp8678_c0_seq3:218-1297(+)
MSGRKQTSDMVGQAGSTVDSVVDSTAGEEKESTVTPKQNKPITLGQRMVAAATGGVLTSLSMTPFDVVKTRLQAQNQPSVVSECCTESLVTQRGVVPQACVVCGNPVTVTKRFNGTTDAFHQIARNEGAGALWRGMIPTLIIAIPATIVYYSSYDFVRANLITNDNYGPPIAGSSARTLAVALVSPLELVRTKFQASRLVGYSEVLSTVHSTVKQQGIHVLFRGLGTTLMRDVPFSAIYWFGYEKMVAALMGSQQRSVPPSFGVALASGASCGSVAAVLTHPFDVIKTRQQSLLGERLGVSPSITTETSAAIVKDITTRFGVRGLFAGLTPRLAKVAPACAIMISTYEMVKQMFAESNN